jgi:hypothetical protein
MSRVSKTELQINLQRFQPLKPLPNKLPIGSWTSPMASFSTLLAFTVRFWPRAKRSPHSRIHKHKDDLVRVNKVRRSSRKC